MKFPTTIAFLLCGLAFSASGAPLFRNPRPVSILPDSGEMPYVLHADFNGDGHADALLVDNYAGRLQVLLSNGSGPFAAPVATPIDLWTGQPAVGDVNRDGKLDVVISGYHTSNARVLLGNGDGTFTAGALFSTAYKPGPVSIADFNGDTLLDVAIASADILALEPHYSFIVHFGNGAGQFSYGNSSDQGPPAQRLITADFNGDGKADLLAGISPSNRLYLGTGNGKFVLTAVLARGSAGVGDFNHDGNFDVAIASSSSSESYLEVLFGGGNGTMSRSATFALGYSLYGLAVADLDADGNSDLIVNVPDGVKFAVLRGNANGSFNDPEFFLLPESPTQLDAADFDRDGAADLLILIRGYTPYFFHGLGNGGFAGQRAFRTHANPTDVSPALGTTGATIADFDRDGHPDVVVSRRHAAGTSPLDVAVMLNDGTGKLRKPIVTSTTLQIASTYPPASPAIAVGDLNGDGKADVVASSPQGAALLGNGDGTFAAPILFSTAGSGAPQLGHFDGDTTLDLLVPGDTFVTVHPGSGNGSFGTGVRSEAEARTVFTGDLNGDGVDDYVSTTGDRTAVAINDGTGRFTATLISTESYVVALADFDGNGKLDLVFEDAQIRLGNGNGTFAAPLSFTGPFFYAPAVPGDFDGDGKLDLAVGTRIYLGNGDGTFRSLASYYSAGVTGAGAADMDGNGSLDLVVSRSYSDDVDVLLTKTTADPTVEAALTLSADKTTSQYAEEVTFTAQAGYGGAVFFEVDGVGRALISPDYNAGIYTATFRTRLPVGSHTITATYAPEEYLSASRTVGVTTGKGTTVAYVNGSPQRAFLRAPVTISASSYGSWTVPGFAPPSGRIVIREGSNVLGEVAAPSGSIQTSTLPAGVYTITADYEGDANFEPSSDTYEQEIEKPQPSMTVTTTPAASQIVAGEPVHMTITVTGNGPPITGTVTVSIDDTALAVVPLVDGKAAYDLTFTWGRHTLWATYSGNDDWHSRSASSFLDVNIGRWGATPVIQVTGGHSGGTVAWIEFSRILGATRYTIWYKPTAASPWTVFQTSNAGQSFFMQENTTWMFAVTAHDAGGNSSPMSAPDLATAVAFTDPALSRGVTPIRPAHVTELRTAINAVRVFAGWSPFSFSTPVAAGQFIRATDLVELRTALAQARNTIGLPALVLTDPTITAESTPVRAAHILELRGGVN